MHFQRIRRNILILMETVLEIIPMYSPLTLQNGGIRMAMDSEIIQIPFLETPKSG